MSKKEISMAQKAELVAHLGGFTAGLADLVMEFVSPLDPSEDQESHDYIRSVMDAADNLLATVLMRQNDPEAMAMLKESTDRVMSELVARHNKGAVKH